MNGPDHYREAERLAAAYKDAITAAEKLPADTLAQAEERSFAAANARSLLSKAHVHAQLALAAATALGTAYGPHAPETGVASQWRGVA